MIEINGTAHETAWIDSADLPVSDIVAVVSLVIALAALKIAKDQKLLDVMATRSGALLTHWQIFSTDDPATCLMNASFEARGPVPFHDVRLCLWDSEDNIIQLDHTHCNILSSSDPARVTKLLVEKAIVTKGYIGLVWSEPHQHNLITMARRWSLDAAGTPDKEERWKWTPFMEKASFGRLSGHWKKVRGPRLMFLSRPNGPTVKRFGSFYAEVLHSDFVPPQKDFSETPCENRVTPVKDDPDFG